MIATWVANAEGWGWIIGTFTLIGSGMALGWWARGWAEHDTTEDEARRAARIYQREIDAARRRHPSHG